MNKVAEKVKITMPINSESFFILAEKLGEFLATVENTNWTIDKAKELYKDDNYLFHIISHHWERIMGQRFYREGTTT